MAESASALARLVTPETLRGLAGKRSYALGEEYYTDGLVSHVVQDGDILAAQVRGTQTYRVKLQAAGDRLKYDCSCPFASDGAFCKHCVAVGLAWLAGPKAGKKSAAVTMDDVFAYLQMQEKEALTSCKICSAGPSNTPDRNIIMTSSQRRRTFSTAVITARRFSIASTRSDGKTRPTSASTRVVSSALLVPRVSIGLQASRERRTGPRWSSISLRWAAKSPSPDIWRMPPQCVSRAGRR